MYQLKSNECTPRLVIQVIQGLDPWFTPNQYKIYTPCNVGVRVGAYSGEREGAKSFDFDLKIVMS